MIVRFSIIASSSRPSLPHLRKNGIAKSYVLIQKNEKSVEKERGRGRERGDCGSPLNIPRRSLPSRFQKNCRWTMIFVASGASSPWRISSYCQWEHTKDRTCVEANQFDDYQREERLNSMNMLLTNAHTTTQIHAHIKYIRTEDTHTRTHADAIRVRSCRI